MSDCERNVNVWKASTVCDNTFSGDGQQKNPDLSGPEACIVSGTDDPTNDPHLAFGDAEILAKANATTAAIMSLNPLGGGVVLNGSVAGGDVRAYNASGSAQLERVLTLGDRFIPINAVPITGTAQQIGSSYIGKLTEVTNAAGCQLNIVDLSASGVTVGEEMHFFSSGNGGITGVTVAGVQSLVQPTGGTVAPKGRTITVKYIAANRWLYIGP